MCPIADPWLCLKEPLIESWQVSIITTSDVRLSVSSHFSLSISLYSGSLNTGTERCEHSFAKRVLLLYTPMPKNQRCPTLSPDHNSKELSFLEDKSLDTVHWTMDRGPVQGKTLIIVHLKIWMNCSPQLGSCCCQHNTNRFMSQILLKSATWRITPNGQSNINWKCPFCFRMFNLSIVSMTDHFVLLTKRKV